jgi:hypothetical protein
MTDDEGLLRDFLNWAVADAWAASEPEPWPNLVPREFVHELDRLTRAELMDVAWYLAQQAHDLADDPDGDMIELRCAIEAVQDRRRPSAVTLRRRGPD